MEEESGCTNTTESFLTESVSVHILTHAVSQYVYEAEK